MVLDLRQDEGLLEAGLAREIVNRWATHSHRLERMISLALASSVCLSPGQL